MEDSLPFPIGARKPSPKEISANDHHNKRNPAVIFFANYSLHFFFNFLRLQMFYDVSNDETKEKFKIDRLEMITRLSQTTKYLQYICQEKIRRAKFAQNTWMYPASPNRIRFCTYFCIKCCVASLKPFLSKDMCEKCINDTINTIVIYTPTFPENSEDDILYYCEEVRKPYFIDFYDRGIYFLLFLEQILHKKEKKKKIKKMYIGQKEKNIVFVIVLDK